MPIPQKPPGGGPAPRREHFSYLGCEAKESHHAYTAGPPMWFDCHCSKRTKPCLQLMTKGELECPRCDPKRPTAEKGYLPIYRATDLAPRCIILPDTMREVADGFRLHDRVTFGREASDNDAVWVTRALSKTPVFNTTLKHRWQEVDLTETLLKLWGIPELRAWYERTHGAPAQASDNTLSQARGISTTHDGIETHIGSKPTGTGAFVVAVGTPGEQFDKSKEKLAASVNRLKPSTNGQHTKPKKE